MVSLKAENAENKAAQGKIIIDHLNNKNKVFEKDLLSLQSWKHSQNETIKILHHQVEELKT